MDDTRAAKAGSPSLAWKPEMNRDISSRADAQGGYVHRMRTTRKRIA